MLKVPLAAACSFRPGRGTALLSMLIVVLAVADEVPVPVAALAGAVKANTVAAVANARTAAPHRKGVVRSVAASAIARRTVRITVFPSSLLCRRSPTCRRSQGGHKG